MHSRLLLILLIYLGLAISYSIVVPIGRGADEWAHYHYARFIADHGRLPISVDERQTAGYKSDWPPLYHLTAAALTAWIETDGPPTFKYRADNFRRQLIPARGPEAILHTQDELFPWQQEILIWHVGRFLSIIFGLGTLIITYFIAKDICTLLSAPLLPLIAVALLAFNPRFIFTSMLFNYDSLTLCLSSLFLWLLIHIVISDYNQQKYKKAQPQIQPSSKNWPVYLLGLLAGLALMTKYLTALLPLMVMMLIIFQIYPQNSRQTSASFSPYLSFYAFIHPLSRFLITYLIVILPWFSYLIITFNEVETYGPVLGTLAPLIRGDGSDRTIEELFAWLSGNEAAEPDYIEKQSYTAWQIIAELPLTFWGNPINRADYPLTWFIVIMTGLTIMASVGIGWQLRFYKLPSAIRRVIILLLLQVSLPLPFMLIRLFGARDALEAVQGRHILFLSAPAFAILFAWGLIFIIRRLSLVPYRLSIQFLLAVLLTGSLSQLTFMAYIYPSLLPVQTTHPNLAEFQQLSQPIILEGGATLVGYQLTELASALQVTLLWQGGQAYATHDYLNALHLINEEEDVVSNWWGYQTEAHYPTRAWEADDYIIDTMWLPLAGVSAGSHQLIWSLFEGVNHEEPTYKIELTEFVVDPSVGQPDDWQLWYKGQKTKNIVTLQPRETAQFHCKHNVDSLSPRCHEWDLIGPDGLTYATFPENWAGRHTNLIIKPDWPAGLYHTSKTSQPLFSVSPHYRNFQIPPISNRTAVNFAGQLKLIGYNLPTRKADPGGGLPLTLYWQAEEWLGEDFVIFARLLDNQGLVWGERDRRPQESYSTLFMAPQEVITDSFALSVKPDTPNGVYFMHLGLYRTVDGQAESLTIINPETGHPTEQTAFTIGPVKIGGPPTGVTIPKPVYHHDMNVILGKQILLHGYDFEDSCQAQLTTPCNLKFIFYWEAIQVLSTDYTMFLHVRDSKGNVVAQQDQQPTNGVYPTGLWDIGETIYDERTVPLNNLPADQYEVAIGLYTLETGQRLTIPDTTDNILQLTTFQLSE